MPSTADNAGRRRLFFALRPDEQTRSAIWASTRVPRINSPGRPVLKDDLHMTLAFLGAVPAAALDDILAAAGDIQAPAMRLRMDRLGHSEVSRSLWLGLGETAPALDALARQLWQRMAGLSLRCAPELWQPHVTVVRGGRRPPSNVDIGRLYWRVRHFGLYRSVPEATPRYQCVAEWPLSIPVA